MTDPASPCPFIQSKEVRPGDVICYSVGGSLICMRVDDVEESESTQGDRMIELIGCRFGRSGALKRNAELSPNTSVVLIRRES